MLLAVVGNVYPWSCPLTQVAKQSIGLQIDVATKLGVSRCNDELQ